MKSILAGQVAVKANTAACFLLIGIALWILKREKTDIVSGWRLAARIAAILASVVGLLSLLECLFGLNLGIDQLLFTAGVEDIPGSVRPGLMSPLTAFGFFGLGLGLLVQDSASRSGRWLSQLLPCGVSIAAIFGVLDFVLDATTTHTHISPVTALILFLFAFGLMFARPQWGLGALVANAGTGGTLTRRLLPAAIFAPLLIGWLRWKGQNAGLFSDWAGVALMTGFLIVLLSGLTAWTGFTVDRSERERRKGQETADRLASIVECSNDAIIGKTTDGIVTSWNPGAEAIYGYPAQEIMGKPISIVIPPNRREEFGAILDKIKRGQRISHHETERLRKDGQIIFLSLSVSPVKDKTGRIVGVSTVARNVTERRRAEERLHQASLYARSLIEASLDPLVTISKDGKIMDVNRAAELATGVERAKLIGSDFCDYFTQPEKAREGYEQVFAEEEVHDYPLAIRHVSGRVIDVLYNASIFRNPAGGVEGVFAAARDITNRKLAEEKLRQASLYTRSLLEASLDPLVTISREGKITDVNQATEKVTGVSRQQLIGSDFSSYFTDPDSARQGYEQVFAQGAVQNYPLAIRNEAGKVTDVLYNASMFRNEAGEVEGVFAAARDITEKKRAQDAVAAERQKFNNILDILPPYIVLLTPDYHVAFANREFTRRFGESGGRRCYEFLFGRNEPCEICETYKVLKAKKPLEWKWTGPDACHYDIYDFPFTDTDGSSFILEMGIDVTERNRAERALRTLSACNEALVHATDEQTLLQGICDLTVDVGGYRMAWVGYAEQDAQKTVRAVAESGVEAGYLDTANITWADEERGHGPTGTAIRTGAVAVCHDLTTDPSFAPWRENALSCGYRSSIVLPLQSGEDVLGAISIYANEAGAFDAAEQHLLEELANNLSYGVMAMRATLERKRGEEEIRKLNHELEERVQQRTAQLHESERRVRRKLESILSPEGDLGHLELADLLDIPAVQSLAEDFYKLAEIPMFILDLKGNPLIAAGWQEICTEFHRAHPESCSNCRESDRELSTGVKPGEFKLYKCKNNLWDVVTPIVVGGEHVGNLFSGQFFFTDETIDHTQFRLQARKYGFDETAYIAALDRVPRLNRSDVETGMMFYVKLAQLLSQISFSSIKLARSMTETSRVNTELAASVKELEAFTYSVSHDLRAPLRHISGFSKILTEEFCSNLPPEAQHHLQRIQDGTRRMGLLVDDLLNLARVSRRDLSFQTASFKSLVDEVIVDLVPECADRQIEWKIGQLPFTECDPGLMKQVFQNLLSNALKFTRTRTQATIEVGQEDQEGITVIFVRDNGVGFNMKYADKLFGVFQRLHRSEDFEGTGVGLATVQRIVQKHGGGIWAEAKLDEGATFYFTLGVPKNSELKTKTAMAGDQS